MSHSFEGEHRISFGKHKGQCLEDIPAQYLLWLAGSDQTRETVGIFGYVLKNRQRLEREAEEAKREQL